eukprot:COSAG01_NODE_45199_length_411_cov_1.487179_2_plen_40_part_01
MEEAARPSWLAAAAVAAAGTNSLPEAQRSYYEGTILLDIR